MPDEKRVLQYIKVRRLAEGGSAHEKTTAAQILLNMEQRHPGIRQAADDLLARQQRAAASGTTPGWWGHPQQTQGFGNWENIFSYIQGLYQGVSDFAESVADAHVGKMLGNKADSASRLTQSGNLLITVKMRIDVYQQALQLNELQREAFRQALHDKLDDQLDRLFKR